MGDPFCGAIDGLEHKGYVQAALTTHPGLAGWARYGPQSQHLQPGRAEKQNLGCLHISLPTLQPQGSYQPWQLLNKQKEMP